MGTIPRNHKKKIAAIRKAAKLCQVHSLHNQFIAEDCDPSYAWKELDTYSFARLIEDSETKWTIHVHSNLWYTLRARQQRGDQEVNEEPFFVTSGEDTHQVVVGDDDNFLCLTCEAEGLRDGFLPDQDGAQRWHDAL